MITRRTKQKSPPAEKVTGTQSIQRAVDILREIASCADAEGLRPSDRDERSKAPIGRIAPGEREPASCLQPHSKTTSSTTTAVS